MSKFTPREKRYIKDVAKNVAIYIAVGVVIDKALDFYIKN